MDTAHDEVARLFENAPAQAEAALLEMLEKNPKDVQAYLTLGATRLKLGRPEEAAEAFRSALRVEADNRAALILLATALDLTNDRPSALSAWQAVARADPGSREALSKVAIRADLAGQDDLAIDARRKLVELEPHSPATVADLAVYLSRAKKHAEAVQMFERVDRLAPGFLKKNPVEGSAYKESKAAIRQS